jgi:hypothetical protein
VQTNPVITIEPIDGFGEILYGGDDIEDDLVSILFNTIASTIPKWRTFKVLRWVRLLNRLVELGEILYGCRKSMHINSSQNFLLYFIYFYIICLYLFYICAENGGEHADNF